MTPEQMHEAASKLRGLAVSSTPLRGEFIRAARMLDRLAVDPTRDPLEALTAPPRRWSATVDAEGNITDAKEIK